MPTKQQLIDALPARKLHLLRDCESIEVVEYYGDIEALWATSHESYKGFRAVSLKCENDGETYQLVFFDHEDDAGTFTFVIVQFDN